MSLIQTVADGPLGRLVLAPLWNRRNAALNDVALESLALEAGDRILEVGYGGGYLLSRMLETVTEGRVAGADASPAMAAACRRRFVREIDAGLAEIRQAPAEALPFGDGAFGKIVSVNSLFYWDDLERGFGEMARVLAPGGLLVLCFTRRESLEGRSGLRGARLFDLGEVEEALGRAGFTEMAAAELADRHRRFWRLTARRGTTV